MDPFRDQLLAQIADLDRRRTELIVMLQDYDNRMEIDDEYDYDQYDDDDSYVYEYEPQGCGDFDDGSSSSATCSI